MPFNLKINLLMTSSPGPRNN